MAAGDVAGDGEAEAGAARIEVARIVEPAEGAENLGAQGFGDAGAVVVDGDLQVIAVARQRHRDVLGVAPGVVQ